MPVSVRPTPIHHQREQINLAAAARTDLTNACCAVYDQLGCKADRAIQQEYL